MIGMLIGSRQAMTVTNENTDDAIAVARAYNTLHLAACADNGRAVTALAAPAVGSAVTVTIFEMLAYEAISSGTPDDPKALTEATWKLLQDRGDRLRHEGEIVESQEESLKILHDNMQKIVDIALPLWRRLGAI